MPGRTTLCKLALKSLALKVRLKSLQAGFKITGTKSRLTIFLQLQTGTIPNKHSANDWHNCSCLFNLKKQLLANGRSFLRKVC